MFQQTTKKEMEYYAITILILTFVFGFNDRALTFDFNYWIKNLILVFIIVTFSFLLKQFVLKKFASRYGFDCEYDIWRIGRYGFSPESKFKYKRKEIKIPIGMILPIILTFISKGLFYFPVVGSSKLKANKLKRVGKLFVKGSSIEFAKVYLSGNLVYLFLTLVFFNIQKWANVNLEIFILVNLYLAFFSLLPLPGLEGCEILFNSLPLYIFSMAFFTATYILLKTNILITFIFSLLIALLILIIYFYKYEQ